jgi:hypothetical protein
MERTNIKSKQAGQGADLTATYIKRPTMILPHPEGFPVGIQGRVLPDPYQKHTQYKEVHQATTNTSVNPLPYEYWIGTSIPQINKGGPTFRLGINEDRK